MLQDMIIFSKSIGNATIDLMISEDYTEAYIEINHNAYQGDEKGQTLVSYEELMDFLTANHVSYGIQEENIKRLSQKPVPTEGLLIAKGVAAIDGQDGYVNYYKKNLEAISHSEDEKGNINFKELEWFFQVDLGEILAEKVLPVEGKDGINVKGEIIRAKLGKPANFKYGKNVAETSDKMFLMALKAGRLEYSGNKVQINDVLTIKENVDTETGNIHFLGDVVVRGDIKSGFDVYCDGSLEVLGVIESSNVNVGKDLVVRGGIQGNTRFLIESGGNIICKFIENATVVSRGDIVTDFIVHSVVNCGGGIMVKGKKGLIVGGEISAKTELRTHIIGSYMGTKTNISIGVDPSKRERMEAYREEKLDYKNRIAVLQPSIDNGKELLARGLMDNIKKISFVKIVEEYNQLVKNINTLDQQMKEIEIEIMENTSGLVVVKEKMYPGTRISIGRFTRHIKDEVGECQMFISENDILISRT